MEIRLWNVVSSLSPENAVRLWSAFSAAGEWRVEVVVLGRLKCILETNRVERRPEKSEERGGDEFGVSRGEKVGSFRWETGDGEEGGAAEREREPRGEEETRGGSH